MLLFSKSYDFTSNILSNLKLSQIKYNTADTKQFLSEVKLSLIVKRSKNKINTNLTVLLSVLSLIYGVYPHLMVGSRVKRGLDVYNFRLDNKQIYLFIDVFVFLTIQKFRKSKEIVKLINASDHCEVQIFNVVNSFILRAIDYDLSQLQNFVVKTELATTFLATKQLNLIKNCFAM